MIAPEGIRRLFTGGGDWRRLPFADLRLWCSRVSGAPVGVWPLSWEMEGVRRCLLRYEAEEMERGRAGRLAATGEAVDCSA